MLSSMLPGMLGSSFQGSVIVTICSDSVYLARFSISASSLGCVVVLCSYSFFASLVVAMSPIGNLFQGGKPVLNISCSATAEYL